MPKQRTFGWPICHRRVCLFRTLQFKSIMPMVHLRSQPQFLRTSLGLLYIGLVQMWWLLERNQRLYPERAGMLDPRGMCWHNWSLWKDRVKGGLSQFVQNNSWMSMVHILGAIFAMFSLQELSNFWWFLWQLRKWRKQMSSET
jgi:hypothetical protein